MSGKLALLTSLLFSLLIVGQASAFDSHPLDVDKYAGKFSTSPVASGINVPWSMVQLPSGQLLVTERAGLLYLVDVETGKKSEISGLPVIDANGQGGLLDIALSPTFDQQPWLYLTYASPEGKRQGSHTALARAKLNLNAKALEELEVLYKGEKNSVRGQHYGSRIAFDDQGYVYFSIGDRGARDINPQNIALDGGKIYRLHIDGRIPKDNPFVHVDNAKTAVYSLGHRNPQGLYFHQATKQLWSHEHGPRGGDELNLIQKGQNYGWPIVSFGVNYNGSIFTQLTEKKGMVQPTLYWKPSIAPSDLIFVSNDKYPRLQGQLLLGSLKFGYIVVVDVLTSAKVKQYKLLSNLGRVRSLLEGIDGTIYLGLDGKGIYKLTLNE